MNDAPRSHFAMIEFLAIKELDPYQLKVYTHYKQRAWELRQDEPSIYDVQIDDSVRYAAKESKMSVGKFSQARRDLVDKGYLVLETLYEPGTSKITGSWVKLVDRWADNAAMFQCSPHEHQEDKQPKQCSPHEHCQAKECSPDERQCSPHEHYLYIRESSPGSESLIDSSSELIESTDDPPVDDDERKLIDQALDHIGFAEQARASVQALPSVELLALIWTAQQRARLNPAGLLNTMIARQQRPDSHMRDLARLGVENRLTTLQQAQQKREQQRGQEQRYRYIFGEFAEFVDS